MMNDILRILACLTLSISWAGEVSASMIDTTAAWDGSHGNIPFGEGYDATYGQTFVVPDDETYLTSWTLYLQEGGVSATDFAFYLLDWNSATRRATGPTLYQSGMITTSNNGGTGGYETFTFDTGGIALEAANDYVAFISVSEFFDGTIGAAAMGTTFTGDAYTDGDFVWLDNDENSNAWTSSEWVVSSIGDMAFTASFSSIPEPSSISLVTIGCLGTVYFRKKIRR